MIQKIANLKGRIDCPKCFSLLEWDNAKDIKVSNGNRYIICPECGQSLVLKKGKDYWEEDNSNGSAIIINTLPEVGVNNTIYLVPDDNNYSIYKYENGEWVDITNGGGDFSSATVTVSGLDQYELASAPMYQDSPTAISGGVIQGNGEFNVILYKGAAVVTLSPFDPQAWIESVSGDIEKMNNITALVRGDGSITFSHD